MLPFLEEKWGNPNNVHRKGSEAREAGEGAMEKVEKMINCKDGGVYFTSGGTESNNWALKGVAFANKDKGKHIIATPIEHKCILNTCKWLEKQGFDITYLKVDKEGFINLEELENALRKDTILVSIMLANNEIGTLEPVKEACQIVKEKSDAYFHTDACQAIGKTEVDVEELGVDLMTISGHKFYAPKGIGALYIRNGVKIDPLLHGGGQEKGRRSGTENVAGIVGMGKAAELVMEEVSKDKEKLRRLQKRIIEGITSRLEKVYLNGPSDLNKRLPGNVNFSIEGVEGESTVMMLDEYGIEVSTGSACSSTKLVPSHVLIAIGLRPEIAHGSIRISAGRFNTDEDVDYFLEVFPEVVNKLREISPLWKG